MIIGCRAHSGFSRRLIKLHRMIILGLIVAVIFTGIGAIPVVSLALILRYWLWRRLSLAAALAVSNALIVTISITLYRVPLFWMAPPFDDMYSVLMFVPGLHIYILGSSLAYKIDHAFHAKLLSVM